MSQERLMLRKISEILRLKEEAGLSNRTIAHARKISNSRVGEMPAPGLGSRSALAAAGRGQHPPCFLT